MTSPAGESSDVEKSLASVTIGDPEVRLSVIAASSHAASRRRWMTLASSGSYVVMLTLAPVSEGGGSAGQGGRCGDRPGLWLRVDGEDVVAHAVDLEPRALGHQQRRVDVVDEREALERLAGLERRAVVHGGGDVAVADEDVARADGRSGRRAHARRVQGRLGGLAGGHDPCRVQLDREAVPRAAGAVHALVLLDEAGAQ